jgi:hypothetical protein
MASSYKILAQSAPASADTETTLYTVPASTEAVISTIVVANITSSATTFRMAVKPNDATVANQHYIAYDVPLAANDSTTLTLGITMDAADTITVESGDADAIAFNVFGTEISEEVS